MPSTPGLFRVECTHPQGCGAVCCGVGDPAKGIRALGWQLFYGAALCPLHRPDGLVAGATEAAKWQAAVTIARVAEGIASLVVPDVQPAIYQPPRQPWMVTDQVWAPADHPSARAAHRQLTTNGQHVAETVPAIVQRGPPAPPGQGHPPAPSPFDQAVPRWRSDG